MQFVKAYWMSLLSGVVAAVGVESGEVVEVRPHPGVIGTEGSLVDGQRALQEWQGRRIQAHVAKEPADGRRRTGDGVALSLHLDPSIESGLVAVAGLETLLQ
jgi:hypothetical protein